MMDMNLFFYDFDFKGTLLEEVVNDLNGGSEFRLDIKDNCSIENLKSEIELIPYGIVSLFVQDDKTLHKALIFFKTFHEPIVAEKIKVICFNEIINPKVTEALYRGGAVDVFDSMVTAKGYKHKLEFLTKFLDKKWAGVAIKKKEKAVNLKDNSKTKGMIVDIEPITHLKDFWLVNHKENITYAMKKWIIFLYGPGPLAIKWQEVTETKLDLTGSDKLFRLIGLKTDEKGHFDSRFFSKDIKETWYFVGQKPKFDVNKIEWIFTGESPALFYQMGNESYDKLMGKDGTLYLAENSKIGETFREVIKSTLGSNLLDDQEVIDKNKNKIKEDENVKTFIGKDNSGSKKAFNPNVNVSENSVPDAKKEEEKLSLDNVEVFQFGKKGGAGAYLEIDESKLSEGEIKKREQINSMIDEFLEDTTLPTSELKTYLFDGGNPEKGIECNISDIFEGDVTLSTKVRTHYKVSDIVGVFMMFKVEGEKNDLTYKGEILEIDEMEEDGEREYFYTVKLNGFEQESYDNFLRDYQKVQNKIVNYMKKIKGAA